MRGRLFVVYLNNNQLGEYYMKNYCPRCKALHTNNELCPIHKEQLKKNPSLLSEAANFTAVAGQYHSQNFPPKLKKH